MKAGRAGAGAMLVACRLAGPSALGAHYAGVKMARNPGSTQRSFGA